MKKIINKKTYNTETSTLIAETWNGLGRNDFNCVEEDLYLSKKGQFFIRYYGGAASKYAETGYGYSSAGQGISLISRDEAYQFLERHEKMEAIQKYFSDEIEEG